MSRYSPSWHTHEGKAIWGPPQNDPNAWGGTILFDREEVDCDCVLECDCGEDTLPGGTQCADCKTKSEDKQ